MRREKTSMKSILEEARAMRTASLTGRKKVQNNSSIRNFSVGNQAIIKPFQSPPHVVNPDPYSNSYMSQQSIRFSQPDIAMSQPRGFIESPFNRTFFDNQSRSIVNLSQLNSSKRVPIHEFQAEKMQDFGVNFLSQLSKHLINSIRKPEKIIYFKQQVQRKAETLLNNSKFDISINKLT